MPAVFSGNNGKPTMNPVKPFAVVALALSLVGGVAAKPGDVPEECRTLLKYRKLTIIVPHAAGGGYDSYARAIAPVLERSSGARVVVSNIPNPVTATRTVGDSGESELRLGLFEVSSLVQSALTYQNFQLEKYIPLGTISVETQAWAGRPDFNLAVFNAQRPIVASVSEPAATIVEVGMVAHLMGIPFRFVPGYNGSSDRFAAVLRKESDMTSNSLTSTLKASRGGDLKPVLMLSEGPKKGYEDVPYLAGKGSVIDQATRSQDEASRKRSFQLASRVVELSNSMRALFVSSKTKPATRQCLGALVEEALFSNEFAKGTNAVGRPIEPLGTEDSIALFKRIVASTKDSAALIESLKHDSLR